MGKHRLVQLLRDPTLEQPSLEYFEVRLPWQSFAVRRETAERVLEASFGFERAEWVRLETVGGSVAWVRTEHVVFVREWSSAQRESERQFWKQIDEEYEEAKKTSASSEEQETTAEGEGPRAGKGTGVSVVEGSEGCESEESGSGRVSLGFVLLMLWVVFLVLRVLGAALGG